MWTLGSYSKTVTEYMVYALIWTISLGCMLSLEYIDQAVPKRHALNVELYIVIRSTNGGVELLSLMTHQKILCFLFL